MLPKRRRLVNACPNDQAAARSAAEDCWHELDETLRVPRPGARYLGSDAPLLGSARADLVRTGVEFAGTKESGRNHVRAMGRGARPCVGSRPALELPDEGRAFFA